LSAAVQMSADMVAPKNIRLMVLSDLADSLLCERMPLRDFIREAWRIIEPAKPLIEAYYVDYMAEYLTAVTEGQITRLILNIPPRKGKSNLATIIWPVWEWTIKPSRRVIASSYAQRLSIKHSLGRRRIISSRWYKEKWGKMVVLRDDQDQKTEFENTARGLMVATSVGGTVTGTGGDVLIADDLLDPKRAESELQRETAHDFFDKTLSTRLDDKTNGAIVVVEQRLHKKDLTGHILETQPGVYEHVVLPAVAEKKTIIVFPNSKRTVIREVGAVLSPKQETSEQIQKQKTAMGTRAFMAQYQQNPSSEEGAFFRRGWWQFYSLSPVEMAKSMDEIIQSWDMSFKDSDGSDYVVGAVWGRKGASKYLLDLLRARMDFPTTCAALRALSGKWPRAIRKVIEDKANGPATISTLKREVPGLIAWPEKGRRQGSKAERAAAAAPHVEAGNVFLPEKAPWVHDFIEEHANFTGKDGDEDDQVDTTSQAMDYFENRIRVSLDVIE
jgi:predicted phage terminase large subunit-like protein